MREALRGVEAPAVKARLVSVKSASNQSAAVCMKTHGMAIRENLFLRR